MKRSIVVCIAAVAFAGSAFAQGKAPEAKPAGTPATGTPAKGTPAEGGMMADMSKMGPGARKPTNEKQAKKEIEDFFKKTEEAHKTGGGMEAMLSAIDFPVYMITDDMKGVPEAKEYSKEQYTAMMKPMYENMPKDMKMTHKPTITLLSDSLANVVDDFTMTMGKQKVSGKSMSFLVKRDGQWKWKVMAEAGWGGMPPPGATGGSGQMPTEGKK